MVTSSKRPHHSQVCCTQSPCPCSRPLLTHASTRDTQTQFWLSLCGVSASWCTQGFVRTLQESDSPVLCKFWRLYGARPPVNVDLYQEGLCHTQVCCTQSPFPHSSPLLTHTFSGDTQTQFLFRLRGVSGSCCAQGLFELSEIFWQVWGLILNTILPLLPSS